MVELLQSARYSSVIFFLLSFSLSLRLLSTPFQLGTSRSHFWGWVGSRCSLSQPFLCHCNKMGRGTEPMHGAASARLLVRGLAYCLLSWQKTREEGREEAQEVRFSHETPRFHENSISSSMKVRPGHPTLLHWHLCSSGVKCM